MARSWLITSRGIARKVKNGGRIDNCPIKDGGVDAKRECPNCNHVIDNSDVTLEWPGLPAGVKFDPSDAELLEHLAGKVGLENSKAHILIDEFIPTLNEDEGICYTHPGNLPGVKKDGSSVHFFHRISNAYGMGRRKRRKIQPSGMSESRVRWHKTGKTKSVLQNGVFKGWKKIMVLYKSNARSSKPDKANWVMHQYHLGPEEDEKDSELVVSKIFFQQQMNIHDKIDMDPPNEEHDIFTARVGPRTPKTTTPQPPRDKESSPSEMNQLGLNYLPEQGEQHQVTEPLLSPLPVVSLKDEENTPAWWAGESQPVNDDPEPSKLHESLLCHEVLDYFHPMEESSLRLSYSNLDAIRDETLAPNNTTCAFSDLDNVLTDTPPDFQLSDLQFGSQDSILSWLDRF